MTVLLSALGREHERQAFHPTALGLLVNPFYFARRGLRDLLLSARSHVHGRVLDVGCGQKPYASLFEVDNYVGLEIDNPRNRAIGIADAFYDGDRFPFGDEEFDCVLSNQVLEHVFEPGRFLAEARRVLKPHGTLVLTIPFLWGEHEQPYDYARYSSFGVRYLIEAVGFEIIELRKSMTGIRALCQLLNAYLFKINPFRTRRPRLVFNTLATAPLNVFGELAAHALPDDVDLYLDNLVVSVKRG